MALYDTANNFFLSDEELDNSPSRQAGIDAETEYRARLQACHLAVRGLLFLRCSQSVQCTAQVFIQRFYCKTSVAAHQIKYVAMGASWLACKIEEAGIRIRDLLLVFHRAIAEWEGSKMTLLDLGGPTYCKMKVEVVNIEKELLRSFGFLLHTGHPHRFLLTYLNTLKLHDIMQDAWNIVNDSFRTTLCVRFKSEVIACGAIFMAARKKKVPMPEQPPWYELFQARKHELAEICLVMTDLYSRPGDNFYPASKKPPEATPETTPISQDLGERQAGAQGGQDEVNIVSNSSSAATPNGQPANGRVAPQPASNGASRPPGDAHSEPPDRDDHGSSRKRRTDRDDQADDRGANRDRSRSDRKRARRRDYHSASASASSWEHERRRKEGERDRDRDRDRDGRRGGEYEREAAYQRQRRDSRRHRHRSGPR
eukprot:evm.model.scf_235.9 EVM.evm.TU.scf_235.9   scf_235:57434-62934(-)